MDLRLQGISHSYGSMEVLRDITLDIPTGRIVSIVGPSGCGKSTLLRLIGGLEMPDGIDRGYFVMPTVFGGVSNDMTIAREEIFGPVLCVMPYGSEQEAIRIANDSDYGLSGAVWSGDLDHARAVAQQLRTGAVHINGAPVDFNAPFGGFKQSGNGRERGTYGIDEYVEIQAIMGYDAA